MKLASLKSKQKIAYIWIIIVSFIKFSLVNQLPLWYMVNTPHDDALMIKLASSIFKGDWLGEYNSNTLVKGLSGPLFVAFNRFIGISYQDALCLLYIFSCLIIIKAFRSKLSATMQAVVYTILLFNPASMDSYSFQKIYRSALTPAQVLFLFGFFFGLYFSIKNKETNVRICLWAVASGLSLFFFWNTREDGIWMIPFIVVLCIIMIFTIFFVYKERKQILLKTVMVLVIFAVFGAGNSLISFVNYRHYGVWTVNELNTGSFPDVLRGLYKIKNDDNIHWVTVSREKMRRVYEQSPTLASISEILERSLDQWDNNDRTPGDGEVEDGWFFWALRAAADQAGIYDDAISADKFWRQVANELEAAFESHAFESQKTMPSPLMPPWRDSSIREFQQAICDSILLIFTFEDTQANQSTINVNDIAEMKKAQVFFDMTGSASLLYIPSEFEQINISGWAFSKNSNEPIEVTLCDENGNIVHEFQLLESRDVSEFYTNEYGMHTLAMCRFSGTFEVRGDGEYYIRFIDEYGSITEVAMNGKVQRDNGNVLYSMDNFSFMPSEQTYASTEKYVMRVNRIVQIYQLLNPIIAVIACICNVVILANFFNCLFKRKEISYAWDQVVIAMAYILSLFVLIIGVSYNQTFSCHSIQPLYYSGAYSVMLCWEVFSILFAGKKIYLLIKKRKE